MSRFSLLFILLSILLLITAGCRKESDPVTPPPTAEELFRRTYPNDAIIYEFALADSGRMFAASTDGILLSIDSGRSWQVVFSPDVVPRNVAVDRSGGVYTISNFALYKSTNNGGSWQLLVADFHEAMHDSIPILFDPSYIAIAPNGTLFVGGRSSGGIARSTDHGDSWHRVPFPYKPVEVMHVSPSGTIIAISGVKEWNLYRSADNGSSWQQDTVSIYDKIILDIDSDRSGTFYACGQGIWRSTDDGNSWMKTATPSGYAMSITTSLSGDLFTCLLGYGTYRSSDHGETWKYVPNTMAKQSDLSLIVDSTGMLHIGTQHYGMFRSIKPANSL